MRARKAYATQRHAPDLQDLMAHLQAHRDPRVRRFAQSLAEEVESEGGQGRSCGDFVPSSRPPAAA